MFKFMVMLVMSSVVAPADTLTFNGYYGLDDGEFSVGNASGRLDGKQIEMWCVDSLHEAISDKWNVKIYDLDAPADLEGTLGLTGQDFQAMFLLGLQFNNTNPNDTNLQHIIWSFTDSSYSLTPIQLQIKAAAMSSVSLYDFSRAHVLVGMAHHKNGTSRVFETGIAQSISTPEPALGLLLAGLSFMISVRFKN